ncbi:hypothetical protein Sjap_003804 [Stephania japonica]|uniref:GIR1-like zinc ribbon domain-containing protein n=1 Tax=Stephania japonica TaxID=461633 RepID=A0AAP0PVU9_9MAGN
MAADVSSLTRTLGGRFNEDKMEEMESRSSGGNCSELITRDLLGSCSRTEAKELDLDSQVPTGWEKRLDLKSGSVYLQRCKSSSSSPMSRHHQNRSASLPELQDLNLPPTPSSSKTLLHEFEKRLDLKLVTTNQDYQSVCTLDMVKSALERAEIKKKKKNKLAVPNHHHHHHHHRYEKQRSSCSFDGGSSSNSSSSSLTLVKDDEEDRPHQKQRSSPSSPSISCSNSGSLFATGCSNCLMYVLMSKTNPKCPRCNTFVVVQSAVINKKPRIDLNTFSD